MERGEIKLDAHAVRVGEDGQNSAPAQAAGCEHLAKLPEGCHSERIARHSHTSPEAHHRESNKEHCQRKYA